MKKYYITFLIISIICIFLEVSSYDPNPYCFRFTWLGPAFDNETAESNNCTANSLTPCFKPLIFLPSPPNVTKLWKSKNRSEYICNLRPGHVCIKYTFTYNNAHCSVVINITRFCGKMTDTTTAISSGCYSQQIDGHTVEACACVTLGGRIACNSSVQSRISLTILIFIFFRFLLY